MARRSRPRSQKKPRRKPARRVKPARRGASSVPETARLRRELADAREQQTAIAEILSVISGSSGELQPVFDAILANATRLCEAKFATLTLYEGDGRFRWAAMYNPPAAYAEARRRVPVMQGTVLYRMVESGRLLHIRDCTQEPEYRARDAAFVGFVELAGARSVLGIPMFKDNAFVGSINIFRQEVAAFADEQIALLQNFAAQAVIAIENARLLNELRQSLEQQTATSEVLRVISSSPAELTPVFDAVIENASRLCGAKFGNLLLFDGTNMRVVAMHNSPIAHQEMRRHNPFIPLDVSIIGPLVKTKAVNHVADITAQEPYANSPLAKVGGMRTALGVPMLKDGTLIGAIGIFHDAVRPFTDKQIELVENFAAQAVIAIENARLLNELRQSLEQQTATADVLRVISSSPGELGPVFQTMLERITHICDAKFANLLLHKEGGFRVAALHGAPPGWTKFRLTDPTVRPRSEHDPLLRVAATKALQHIADLRLEDAYLERDPPIVAMAEVAGARTVLLVPMFKDSDLVGIIGIYRQEVRPFTDKQIALAQNFAAQAVIAIENARLLNELRQSLEQQTATADVLRVISASPGDLAPVFQTLLRNAVRICEATAGNIYRWEGDALRLVTTHNTPPPFAEFLRRTPVRATANNPVGRMQATKSLVHVADLMQQPAYIEKKDAAIVAAADLGGVRTQLSVPLLKDNQFIGAITLWRSEVRPFDDRQIALVQNFAAQAVIAIENARLLNELRQRTDDLTESLEQQTATSQVLQVISSSPGKLEPVFQALLENAVRICGATFGALPLWDGDALRIAALHNFPPKFAELLKHAPQRPNPSVPVARMVRTKTIVHVADITKEQAYIERDPLIVGGVEEGGYRTLLAVPMLKNDQLIGGIIIFRQEVRPFTDKQIALVQNFAAQAVIAIENARLLNELRQRTDDLSKSLEDLRTAQDRLVQTQKLAELGQLTAGIAHEIKNPLNFVNNFAALSAELIGELQETLGRVSADEATRSEIADLSETLRANLDKIVQHGKRADSIVKNMLQHSREGSTDRRPVDVNAVVEESLNLAYHGARAEKQGFTVTLQRAFDPQAGQAHVFPQELTRVLLNLIANGFYAAAKRQAERDGHEAVLTAATRDLGDKVEIRIRDNGTGIPPEVKEKIFNPFFTTKPAGEGTGLGLSISHDIVVKQHGGAIEVDSEPGEFTEVRIVLPRASG